jgi:hypothetical protein
LNVQLGIFNTKEDIEAMQRKVDKKTAVYTSEKRYALLPLATRRRQAMVKVRAMLLELEGQTVYISVDSGTRGHFHLDNLRLSNLRIRRWSCWGDDFPGYWWIEGQKGACIRINTAQLYDLRRQEYEGHTHWLVDCFNGYRTHELDKYKMPGFDCLSIIQYGDNQHPTFVYCPKCWLVGREDAGKCPKCGTDPEPVLFIERGAAVFDSGIHG